MPGAPQSPPKRSSMQPSRPAPAPPVGSLQATNGSPVKRSPSSPYPSSRLDSRPVITTITSAGLPISELVPQRPAPQPPAAKRTSNVLTKGHGASQSVSSISISTPIPQKSKSSPPAPRRPPPPLATTTVQIPQPMQYNPEFPTANPSAQSAFLPMNGAPATPKQRKRRSGSRRSDGTSPHATRNSPRAHSDEYPSTKPDKGIFGKFVSGMTKGLTTSNKRERMEISTPYDPVHLTHVGFNYHTGEFTVLLFLEMD